MLRVKTYLDKSKMPGAGIGLFTAEDILKGATIWQLDKGFDLEIHEADWPEGVSKDFLRWYGYNPASEGGYIICLDNARFMNHSRTPNGIGGSLGTTIAARKIFSGEELTEDYRDLLHPSRTIGMDFL